MKTKKGLTAPLFIVGIGTLVLSCTDKTPGMPNVVFILADDLGWAQTGSYGSDYYHTPNIDRLATEGIRFTNAYSAATICSPARASIMTGKYPARLRITDYIPGNTRDDFPLTTPDFQKFLPLEEYTLGNLFSDMGYQTAMFGKWHLSAAKFGPGSLDYNPDKQGFSEYFVIDKPERTTNPEHDPHASDSIGNSSVAFIRNNVHAPFFLFVSFSAIHDPLVERADSIAKWIENAASHKPENNPIIAAILSRMDRNIGIILSTLDELNLSENTMVVFYSDNGGLAENNVVYNHDDPELKIARQSPLRKGKGWLYEGGIRVPLIVKWKGTIKSNQVSHELVSSYDFMPTFYELLNCESELTTDGISILSHLKNGSPLPERNHYWHYPHYHSQSGMVPAGALRSGKWKLIEYYEKSILERGESAFELYDLETDISESVNLADSLETLTMKFSGELKRWREELNAQMPVPNLKYSSSASDTSKN